MLKRIGVLLAVVALVASACGRTRSAAPTTVDVQVDARTDAFNLAATAYFPSAVTAHAGDTVHFTSVFRGEPHTVTFGTLVDAGLAAFDRMAATNPAADDHSVPELAKIPDMLPQGPGDANQATAQPCYVDTGDPTGPGATPCPKRAQPELTGRQSVYNSGWMADGEAFDVRLAKTIAPGVYRYMCALHRSAMTGKITVVLAKTKLPAAADVRAQADREIQHVVSLLTPAVARALQAPASQASAGVGAQTVRDALGSVFAPKSISVPVGGSVTWTVFGPHTITFNAPESFRPAISKAPDGGVHLNPSAFIPAGGPGQPRSPPATAPGPPRVLDAGRWDGSGVHSSGIFLSFPPQLLAYKLTFTRAGTYQYICTIHPDMQGTVKVG